MLSFGPASTFLFSSLPSCRFLECSSRRRSAKQILHWTGLDQTGIIATMDPMDCNLSDSSSSSPPADTIHVHSSTAKRTASDAGLKGMRPPKSVKRRASKACQCCRSRKVRCNVVEHGAPCTNCRLDEVECIVSESKRKKLVLT